ncbi:MAG: hypothetical protein AB7L41_06160 [Flavobacteriaceae bacterium]
MLRPVLTVAPAEPAVSMDEIKTYLAIEHGDDDAMLAALRDAAVAHYDGWTGVLGRCLVTQTWRVDLCDWPGSGCIRLPFPDVTAATVSYFDEANVEQTVSSSFYELLEDARGAFVRFLNEFTSPGVYDDRSDAVRVTLVAGYGDAAEVPEPVKLAIKMRAGWRYRNRDGLASSDAAEGIDRAADSAAAPYKRRRI